jgi:hypothetical protein
MTKDNEMAEVGTKKRWMPIVLGLSLAVNLAVIAAVSGAALRHKNYDKGRQHVDKGGAIYMRALPHETRREIFGKLRENKRNIGINPAEMLDILKHVPFDVDAATRVLNAQNDAGLQRVQAVTDAWLTEITEMSVKERDAYAGRLQELLEQREERRKEKAASRK